MRLNSVMTTLGARAAALDVAGAALALALAALLGAAAARAAASGGTPDADAAARTQVQTKGFLYKQIAVDEASARAGEGQQVSMGGHPITLHGQAIAVGEKLRPATLEDPALRKVAIGAGRGRVRILSIVPSLKTPTCEQQTHYLSEKSGSLADRVGLVTISADSPATQGEFAREAGITNVTFLSDAGALEFGRAHGLLIEKPRMLTRAVMVVDAGDVVRYLQVVPEVSHMPDMDAAFAFARSLVGR